MATPTAQQVHALITYYKGAAEAQVGKRVTINRNASSYAFKSILMDYSPSEARELIDYYVKHYEPDLQWFTYNYEKVDDAMREAAQEDEMRAKIRKETAQRLEEWRNRWQK